MLTLLLLLTSPIVHAQAPAWKTECTLQHSEVKDRVWLESVSAQVMKFSYAAAEGPHTPTEPPRSPDEWVEMKRIADQDSTASFVTLSGEQGAEVKMTLQIPTAWANRTAPSSAKKFEGLLITEIPEMDMRTEQPLLCTLRK